MKQLCISLVLLAAPHGAGAAKTSSWRLERSQATSPSQRQNGTGKLFTIFHQQTCTGVPYTKDLPADCDGWSGITQEACELKCSDDAAAPNCPKETCHAAVFYPASGACHLFKECEAVEPSLGSVTLMDQATVAKEQAAEKRLKQDVDRVASRTDELMSAMPMVLINLTNFSTLLHDADGTLPQSREVTHKFGNVVDDLELLYDKVQGFLLALHDRMAPGEGEKRCPFRKETSIMACIGLARCLIQEVVPLELSMDAFAALQEQVERFEDITWPLLKQALIAEGDGEDDLDLPQARCDGVTTADPHALAGPALLQTETKAAEGSAHSQTLAMSAALRQAMASTHRILDAHGANASMQVTGKSLEKLWHPICKNLPCDPTNMYDVFLATHKQSLALLETGAVGHLHLEIRHRVKMEMRLQHFVAEHHSGDVTFFHEHTMASSKDATAAYATRGREAVLNVVIPYVKQAAERDAERALRLVDHVEFEKFIAAMEKQELEKKRQMRAKPHSAIAHLEKLSDVEEEDEEDEEDSNDNIEPTEFAEEEPRENESLLSLSHNASGPHWCVGKTIVLWNHEQQHYARMSGSRMERGHKGWHKEIPYAWTWERFVCVDAGDGQVAFHNPHHNRFLRMNGDRGVMDRSSVMGRSKLKPEYTWEKFVLKDMGNGHFALFNRHFKKFMKMGDGDELVTSGRRQGAWDIPSGWTWEKFYFQKVPESPSGHGFWFCGRTVVLWSHAHQTYMRMDKNDIEQGEDGWREPFPSNWEWERFVPVMAGHGEVAFHNTKWNRWIRMNSQGKLDRSAEIDQRRLTESMTWERFRVVDMGEGHIALYNTHFRRFVKMYKGKEGTQVGTTDKMNYWDIPKKWTYEKFFVLEVGKASNCNFWCRLRKGIEKIVDKVASFVKKLLQCFGQWSSVASKGYAREISAHVALNFGASASINLGSFQDLLQGKPPGTSISVWANLGAGATTKWTWGGVGASLWLSCGKSCYFGVSVGAVFVAWQKDTTCALGANLLGMPCSRSVGGTFLLICCNFDLITGENNCR